MIKEFHIKNYKSILDHKLELGRLNVFIGENGCGKTNLLEAMAMASAALVNKLDTEELYSKGIRVAKPAITFSSFLGSEAINAIRMRWVAPMFDDDDDRNVSVVDFDITSPDPDDITAIWSERALEKRERDFLERVAKALAPEGMPMQQPALARPFSGIFQRTFLSAGLGDFVIYNINALALRGIENVSKRTPLGIHGESLDVLISTFTKKERDELLRRSKFISWVDKILIDEQDQLKFKGHKLGRSTSTLYFRDRFMRKRNNVFSAENANEGILHVLFYLALFISSKTPKIFGIDNIETALNPQLCRELTKELAALAKTHDKQALITTHNPAILDGLDLHDEDQRLFVVYRNDHGHTVTRRIKLKPDAGGEKLKLSELWMRGHLGGLPRRF